MELVDKIANTIREVDGSNTKTAPELADALQERGFFFLTPWNALVEAIHDIDNSGKLGAGALSEALLVEFPGYENLL